LHLFSSKKAKKPLAKLVAICYILIIEDRKSARAESTAMKNLNEIYDQIKNLRLKKYEVEKASYADAFKGNLSREAKIKAVEEGLKRVKPELDMLEAEVASLYERAGRLNAITMEGLQASPEFKDAVAGKILAGWRVRDGDVNRRATKQEAGYLFRRFGDETSARMQRGFKL